MNKDAQYYFKRSEEKFQADDLQGGYNDLNEAIRFEPYNPHYYLVRGLRRYEESAYKEDMPMEEYMEYQQANLQLASSDFSKTLAIATDLKMQVEAYQKRMFCYFFLGQSEDLIKDATWLINHGFGNGRTYEWRGHCYGDLGQFEEAIQDYTTAIQLLPDYDTKFGRAVVYYRAGMYKEVVEDCTYVLSLNDLVPHYRSNVYHRRSWAYYKLNDLKSSLEDANQVQLLHGQKPFSNMEGYIKSMKNLEAYLSERGEI